MSFVDIPLKPCPWCKKTPQLSMRYGDYRQDETWLWYVGCMNEKCNVRPKSRHVCLRNTSKYLKERIFKKIFDMTDFWNKENPMKAYEAKRLNLEDIDKICEQERKKHENFI